MNSRRFVDDSYLDVENIPPVCVLYYQNSVIGIEHTCKQLPDGSTLICAPKLHPTGHTVVTHDPLTIHPSILCPDCGLHGFITNGTWVSA